MKSPSYSVCEECGEDCIQEKEMVPESPCWGAVEYEDDTPDGVEIHLCRGHREYWDWCRGRETARRYVAEGSGRSCGSEEKSEPLRRKGRRADAE